MQPLRLVVEEFVMLSERKYWVLTLARGMVAVLIGGGIFALPDLARTLFLLPISVTISLILFAAYGILDGCLLIAIRRQTSIPVLRWTHGVQGVASLTMGALLLSLFFEHAKLMWFLSLAAIQAAFTACAEFVMAKHARKSNTRMWDYAATCVAGIFAIFYIYVRLLLTEQLTYGQVSWLIYAFLIAFGIAQCINAAGMLLQGSTGRRSTTLSNK